MYMIVNVSKLKLNKNEGKSYQAQKRNSYVYRIFFVFYLNLTCSVF